MLSGNNNNKATKTIKFIVGRLIRPEKKERTESKKERKKTNKNNCLSLFAAAAAAVVIISVLFSTMDVIFMIFNELRVKKTWM